MKLLFDQNISFRIVKILEDHFPGSAQVRTLALEDATDLQIWAFARDNNFIIVTFDADFYDFSNLYGQPPKIIWLRTGNTKTSNISDILLLNKEIIKSFLNDESISCLEIY
ncbi:hypothetical protein GZH53_11495 [Flavihumibacter sp. R14]|nr:hypothetical protein [Flavihumibacter soli]